MTKNERRFNPLVGLIVAVVGLLVLLVAQHVPNRHRMEADLTQRSEQALHSAGLSEVGVTFTGRDGRLSAGSPVEAERALGIVRSLDGVRSAEAQLPPVPQVAAVPVPPSVVLRWAASRVSLSGKVPTDVARASLVEAAATVLGAGAVDDWLTVDDGVTDAALSGLPGVLRAFGRDTNDTTAELSDGSLVLTGTVSSEMKKSGVMAAALGAGAAVVDRISVADVRQQLTRLPAPTFRFGGVELTPAGRASLIAMGQVLGANPSTRVRIEGHTDSTGPADWNLTLSRARAEAVRDFLVTQGVTAERMSTAGYGETRPKLSNTSSADRAANRRVELVASNDVRGNNDS